MSKKEFLSVFFIFLSGLAGFAQHIPPKPDPPRLVNDFAKQLNPTEAAALEQKLVAYNDSTSTQITVVVVPTTGDYPIADYAFALGREWGVGQQGKNNGLVILWASSDRKVFIATGYGMEGAIPDAIANRIINQVIIPDFRNGMFYRGLDKGVDAIIRYASGEYKADPADEEEGFPVGLLVFIIIFIIVLIAISAGGKGGNNRGRGYNAGPVFWPYTTYSGRGRSSGSWGGGGFGGGFGGGGGGFGGFGGGSFGGGGAGGSY
ncbi:MAG: methanol dehydrogenase [Cytophagaceae bacterium SCN 52-12]|nr:MAG: methanol dehydrogenase [Cytophagaceae bacterium SCN 52-12]